MSTSWIDELNPAQRQAVTHGHGTITFYVNTRDWKPVSDGFGAPTTLSLDTGVEEVAFVKIDNDIYLHIVVAAQAHNALYVFLDDGQANFAHDFDPTMRDRYQLHPSFDQAFCWGIDAGHLNGGIRQDLATTLQNTNEVSVLRGIGDGTFQRPAPNSGYLYSVEPTAGDADNPIQVKIVDLNQDGFGDLVTSNHFSANISVLINRMIVAGGPGGGL